MINRNLLWANEVFNIEKLDELLASFFSRYLKSLFIAEWSEKEGKLIRAADMVCAYEKGCDNNELSGLINSEINKTLLDRICRALPDGYVRSRHHNNEYEQYTIHPIWYGGSDCLEGGGLSTCYFLLAFASVHWDNGTIEMPALPLEHYESALLRHFAKAHEHLSKGASKPNRRKVAELVSQVLVREYQERNYDKRVFDPLRHVSNKVLTSDTRASIETVLGPYRQALATLQSLIEDPSTSEATIQKHLEQNDWMFGSEYSVLLDRRTWTRDNTVDYMLQRTTDNFLEIIEIKTPFREPLLLHDTSHDSYYSSRKLSRVIGQVTHYIEEVERARDAILSKDGFDTSKIRAKIIIGRDGDLGQQTALRNLNSHLNRIEVVTYDQLLKIAANVLNIFEREMKD